MEKQEKTTRQNAEKSSSFPVEPGIFYPAAAILTALVIWGLISSSTFSSAANTALGFTLKYFGSGYLLAGTLFLLFIIGVAVSPVGKIKLGGKDAKPEVTYIQWFAMALCAGIGIGILFWGVAEPMYHFYGPPAGQGLEGFTAESAQFAMTISWVHWALHPYAIYSLFGLGIAVATYNTKLPFRVSSALYPLIGDNIYGFWGKLVDVLAVIGIMGAISTSLGFGTMQLGSGIQYFTDIESSMGLWIAIIVIVTFAFTLSSVTGLQKGIKFLSQQNLRIYMIMLAFVLLLGPTLFIINLFTQTIADYLAAIIPAGLFADPFNVSEGWAGGWTIFYWAWWAAAAPVVGLFLARVSYGRTIREFAAINIFTPALFGMIWFAVFGGTAIHLDFMDGAGIMEVINTVGVEIALYELLAQFPLSAIMIPLAFLAVAISFITLADSMTSSLAIMTTKSEKGDLERHEREEAPTSLKLIWGVLLGGLTIVLLLIGTIQAVQTSSIVTALPIFVIGILIMVSLLIHFKQSGEKPGQME